MPQFDLKSCFLKCDLVVGKGLIEFSHMAHSTVGRREVDLSLLKGVVTLILHAICVHNFILLSVSLKVLLLFDI